MIIKANTKTMFILLIEFVKSKDRNNYSNYNKQRLIQLKVNIYRGVIR